ncbi:MAG: N-acetyl-gamma-glutamyl-phosphate reductase [Capsulimonadaceae bacterium]
MEQRLVKAGIIGVSGYGGGELARILASHPAVELTYVSSNTYLGKPLSAALPGVAGRIELVCEDLDPAVAIERCDVIFLAGEAGMAMHLAPQMVDAGRKVIDISADFRLRDPAMYSQWYKAEHTAPAWISRAVYGLSELYRDQIRGAQLLANPGCYPTSAILALAPLLARDVVDRRSIIVDSYSGVSGAGRSKFGPDYHFPEVNESIRPYAVGGLHRHTPEIEQALGDIAGEPVTITFTPHLAPITRGILTTAYGSLTRDHSPETLQAMYSEFYAREPFVVVLDAGTFPASKHTVGTNYCYIGVTVDVRTGRAIVVSTEDNLVKGMAGQAVQNMNLMTGIEETCGLTMAALWP